MAKPIWSEQDGVYYLRKGDRVVGTVEEGRGRPGVHLAFLHHRGRSIPMGEFSECDGLELAKEQLDRMFKDWSVG